jgi:hypothetical protein
MTQLQQGDVNIESVAKIPSDAKPRKSRVLAEGEATGHKHVIEGDVELFELGDKIFMRILGGDCRVVHEEHGEIAVPPGEYEVRRTPEIDHFTDQARMVAD